MNDIKITVLVAIYNAEAYLHKCLDSLQSQTLRECQFICIDDCSIDSSASVVQQYAGSDSRFCLLRTPVNSGQAVARNLGLGFAKGEYITMLDADDWFSPDALEKAYNKTKEIPDCDCVLFRMLRVEDGRVQPADEQPYSVLTGQSAFRLSLGWQIHGLYIVSRSIHLQYPYDTSCRLYSDDNTTRLHFLHSRYVAFSDGIYYYRQHSESMTHKYSPLRFLFMDAFSSMKRHILHEIDEGNIERPDDVLTCFENLRWLNYLSLVWYYLENKEKMSDSEESDIINRLQTKLHTFETSRIFWRYKLRLGYMPVSNWTLFILHERLFTAVHPLYDRLKSLCSFLR